MTFLCISHVSAAVCAASVALAGCNQVLGINEPEEVLSPPVRYYAWDGSTGDTSVGSDDTGDAPRDAATDVSLDLLPIPADTTPELGRDRTIPIVDARLDGPRCVVRILDGGGMCGVACSMLCPLNVICLGNADCASGRCYAGRCTLPTCLNRARDGDETDVDCGGPCPVCGPGLRCRMSGDCAGGICTGGICNPPPADASIDTFVDAPRSIDVRVDPDTAGGPDTAVDADATFTGDAAIPMDAFDATFDGE